VKRDLGFERLIEGLPERVFDAFTSPEGQREFYGQDAPGWIVDSRCDLRVGGVWSISFGPRRGSCTTATSSRRSTARTGSASRRPRRASSRSRTSEVADGHASEAETRRSPLALPVKRDRDSLERLRQAHRVGHHAEADLKRRGRCVPDNRIAPPNTESLNGVGESIHGQPILARDFATKPRRARPSGHSVGTFRRYAPAGRQPEATAGLRLPGSRRPTVSPRRGGPSKRDRAACTDDSGADCGLPRPGGGVAIAVGGQHPDCSQRAPLPDPSLPRSSPGVGDPLSRSAH
jgi:hypothetical protein